MPPAAESACPGHQAARPMSAVRAGVKNRAMTKAATAIPTEMAKPIWLRVDCPASIREAKEPASEVAENQPLSG